MNFQSGHLRGWGRRYMIRTEEALKRGGEKEVGIGKATLSTENTMGLERTGLVVEIWASSTRMRQYKHELPERGHYAEDHLSLSF